MKPSDLQRISRILPFFSSVPQEEWALTQVMTVTPETPHAVREGHVLQHALFVLDGSVRIYKISGQGREVTLYRVRQGQSCVLMTASILGEIGYEASASIETETEVLLIPVPLFQQWMDRHKPVRQFIFRQIAQHIASVTERLEQIAFNSIQHRIASYLLDQTVEPIALTHERLAFELGTAREVVSRALNELAKQQILVLRRGEIEIADRRCLAHIADEG